MTSDHHEQNPVDKGGFHTRQTAMIQVPRALVASVLAAVVDVSVYSILIWVFTIPPVISSIGGYLTGGLVQWYACSRWVFDDKRSEDAKKSFQDIVFFYLLSLGGLIITMGTIFILYDTLKYHELLAKIAALALAFIWNFLSRKFFIFERK